MLLVSTPHLFLKLYELDIRFLFKYTVFENRYGVNNSIVTQPLSDYNILWQENQLIKQTI
jgi:hypothetical protein